MFFVTKEKHTLFQLVDYRVEFTKWWTTEFKTIKFPAQGTVFDYYIDHETHKFEPWNKLVPKFELDPEMPLQVRFVALCEWHFNYPIYSVIRQSFFLSN